MFGFGIIASLDTIKLTQSLMCVIAFIILFEYSTGFIEFVLGSSSLYMRMVQKIYKELMMMGIISFILTMYEAVQDDLSKNNQEWLLAVDVAHYFLFYLAIFFVCHAIYLIRLSVMTSKYYNTYTLSSVEETLESLMALSKNWFQRTVYMIFPTQLRYKVEFKLIQLLFSDAYDVPTEFDFAAYLSSCYARYAFKIIDIGFFEWSIVIAAVTVNYLRIRYSGSFNCNYDYGPHYGVRSSQKSSTDDHATTGSTDDHRRLGSSTIVDDYRSESDTECLISNYIFFVLIGFLLLIYVFALSLSARLYERKMYQRVGLKDQTIEERIKFFQWLNSQSESSDSVFEEHRQEAHETPNSRRDKRQDTRRASVSIFKKSSKVKGDSGSQLDKIQKLKSRIIMFQDTYEVNEETQFFIAVEKMLRQSVNAWHDAVYQLRLRMIRIYSSCIVRNDKHSGKVSHDPCAVISSMKSKQESSKSLESVTDDIEGLRDQTEVRNSRKSSISESLAQLRRTASMLTRQKMMKTLEEDEEEAGQDVSTDENNKGKENNNLWTLSHTLTSTFSMKYEQFVDRDSKIEKIKDQFFRRKKSVILSYIKLFNPGVEVKIDDPNILLNNIQSLFLFGNKIWFDKAVEIAIIMHCLYLSMWAMNFITTIQDAKIPVHNQVIIVIPILLIGMTLGHIIRTLSVLDAVCNLNLDAMKSVIEDTEDTINLIENLRKDIDEGINQLGDVNVSRLQLMQELFLQIDEDKSGYLDRLEFRNLLRQLELCYTEDRFNRLFNWVDFDGSGRVNFDEVHDLLLGHMTS